MNHHPALTEVRDVYDRTHYVLTEELASNERRLLRVFHADGKPLMTRWKGASATDWQPVRLARFNICPHDRATWTAYRFPDGTPGDYCSACCPERNAR